MWIPPEIKDPIVRHHPTRKSVGYFGAVRLRDGKLICQRETGKFNGETYLDFLKHLKRRACRSGRRVVMIVDNAKYHHARLHKSWRELHAPDFQLYFLPPYSPELNPIERVWKLTCRWRIRVHAAIGVWYNPRQRFCQRYDFKSMPFDSGVSTGVFPPKDTWLRYSL
jgi:transposase